MGAFLLYNATEKNLNIEAARKTFLDKGFKSPQEFIIGNNKLLLYVKQTVDIKNYFNQDNWSIYAIGTIVYKGLSYNDTLKKLLDDYKQQRLDVDEIQGNYCVIFQHFDNVEIMTDPLNVQQLFTNKKRDFLTSSFLAAMMVVPGKLTLNRLACHEKLTTGYICGNDTLFNEIIKITTNEKFMHNNNFQFINNDYHSGDLTYHTGGLKDSASKQVEIINRYLKGIQDLAAEYKAEIGLSGGYDSRLLYACTFKAWPFKISAHTHATEGVEMHSLEKEIVERMTSAKGTNLHIVPTFRMDAYSNDEIEDILLDGLFFFDGRCTHHMGAFSPVYTRRYKMSTMGECHLTLNGLGGEMYRNYYLTSRNKVNFKEWMKAKLYSANIQIVFKRANDFETLHSYIIPKMERHLDINLSRRVSNINIRRYYSELRMPECDALNCNAHNQLGFYLTPFIEKNLIQGAYKGIPYIGYSGEYQAEMIRQADELLVNFTSHYGFSFANEPLKYKLYALIRGYFPDKLWNIRTRYLRFQGKTFVRDLQYFNRVKEKCSYLQQAAEFIELLFPEINFDELRRDYAMMPNSTYISVLFYHFKERIRV